MKKVIKKAILPVAGLGTRFLPATKVLSKAMLVLFNKPIIQYIVEEAINSGIEEFIFITGKNTVLIKDHFDISYKLDDNVLKNNQSKKYKEILAKSIPIPKKTFFVRQQHPQGLGHAIYCAKALIANEPFAVLLPDEYLSSEIPCLKNMLSLYYDLEEEVNIVAVKETALENISAYGVVRPKFDDTSAKNNQSYFSVAEIVEKPNINEAPSNYAVIGRYILQPSIFNYLEKSQVGLNGEIQLTDAIAKSIGNHDTYAYVYKDKRFDCGNPLGLLTASLHVALQSYEKETIINLIKKNL